MSYTRPSGDAADFTWSGDSAYSRPGGGAADFDWQDGYVASGFESMQAGVPATPLPASGFESEGFGSPTARVGYLASGFLSTDFGTPEAEGYKQASGFCSTQYGAASSPLASTGFISTRTGTPQIPLIAEGFCVTSIGSARGYQFWHQVTLSSSTVVSQAYYAFAQTCEATGFCGTHVGAPFSWSVTISGGYLCFQEGKRATRFGTPTTPVDVTKKAHGFRSRHMGKPGATWSMVGVVTRIGVPMEISTLGLSGISVASVGSPISRRRQPETGSTSTRFGAAGVVMGRPAKGFCSTHVGQPSKPGVYAKAYTLRPRTRVSAAKAWRAFNYPASGLNVSGFGEASATQTYPARHPPPVSRIGTPMRERPATC